MGYRLNIVHGAETHSHDVAGTEPLLHSLDRVMNSPIKVGCKGGGCGVCKVRVVAGSYTSKPMSKAHITEQEKTAGIVLACRIIPTSNLTVLPMGNTQNHDK